jgi:hypothetical protein
MRGMKIVRRKNKLLLPALAGALGLLAFPVGHAMADSSAAGAGLSSFHHVVADPAAGYVFLSGSSGIVVTDSSGNVVTTLDSGNSVAGLALNGDGSTLYAALTTGSANSNSIDAISVPASGSSFTENYTPLPGGDVPGSLAFQSGTLWVSYTDSSGSGGIGAFQPGSGTFTSAGNDSWPAAPDLAADPSDAGNGTLVAAAGGTATVYATAGGTLAAGASSSSLNCATETQLAVAPGGTDFFAACGSAVNEYATASLSAQPTSYAAGSSVAVGADGDVAVGTSSGVDVYGASSSADAGGLLNAVSPGPLAPGGLAWDNLASGQQLVAVTGSGSSYTAQILDSPEQAKPSLTLAASGTPVADHVELGGTFTLSNNEVPAGATVTITRTSGSSGTGTSTPVGAPVTVGADGGFTVTDTNVAVGTYTYTATVSLPAGSAATAPAPVPVTVNVVGNSAALKLSGPAQADIINPMRFTGAVTLKGGDVPVGSPITITRKFGKSTDKFTVHTTTTSGGYTFSQSVTGLGTYTYTAAYAGDSALKIPAAAAVTHKVVTTKIKAPLTVTGPTSYTYEPKIWVTAHLGSTYSNRTVAVYAQTAGSKTRKLIKRGRVNSNGNLIIADTTPYTTKFTAVFSGDAHYAGRSVTHTVTVMARVWLSMTGYYGSKKVSGTTYRLYHHNGQLVVTVRVGPNKYGQCAWVQAQEYYKGAWRTNENTSCKSLSASSQLYGYLTVSNADHGYEYRVRAHFLPSGSNPSDAGNASGWQYVMIEN